MISTGCCGATNENGRGNAAPEVVVKSVLLLLRFLLRGFLRLLLCSHCCLLLRVWGNAIVSSIRAERKSARRIARAKSGGVRASRHQVRIANPAQRLRALGFEAGFLPRLISRDASSLSCFLAFLRLLSSFLT